MSSLKTTKLLLTTTAIVAVSAIAFDANATANLGAGASDYTTTNDGDGTGVSTNGGAVTGSNDANATIIMDDATDANNRLEVAGGSVTNATGDNTVATVEVTEDSALINITAGGTVSSGGTGDAILISASGAGSTGNTINVTNGSVSGSTNAINITGGTAATTINIDSTNGSTSGNIILSTNGDVINVTGDGSNAAIGGNITGGAGSTLDFNLTTGTDTNTIGGTVTNVANIDVEQGVITTNGNISGATTLDIGEGGTAELDIATNDDDISATTITVHSGGTLTANGAGASVVTGTFNMNSGSALTTDSDTTFNGNANIAGAVTGDFALAAGDHTVTLSNGAGFSAALTGDTDNTTDTLNVTAGSGNTVAVGGALTNFNDVNITTGELQLDAAGNNVGQIVINGANAVLDLNGTLTADDQGVTLTQGTLDTGGNAITGDVSISSTAGTVTGNVVVGAGTHTVTVTGDGTNNIAGNIDGSAGGNDVFTVNLDSASDALSVGAITDMEDINIDSGAVTVTGDITGATTLDIGAGDALDVTAASAVTAATVTVAGTYTTDAAAVLTGNLNLDSTTGSVSGALQLGAAGHTVTVSGDGTNNVAGSVTGGAGADTFTVNLGTATDTLSVGALSAIEDINIDSGIVTATGNITGATTLDVGAGDALDISGITDVTAGTTTVAGTLTTAGTAVITGDLNVVTTTGSTSGAVQLGNGNHTVTYSGDATNGTLSQITGGTGTDAVVFNTSGTMTTGAAIDLGTGADTLTVDQGVLSAGHALSAETVNIDQGTLSTSAGVTGTTTVMGTDGTATLTIGGGTYNAGDITAAANGNTLNLDLASGATLSNNIDWSASTGGTQTIDLDTGATFAGTITGGAGAETLTVTGGSTFTTAGAITNIDNIVVNGAAGTNLTIADTFAVTGAATANIAADNTLTANESVTGTGALTLNGTLNVASDANVQFATAAAAGANSAYTVNIGSNTADDASDIILTGGGFDMTNTTVTVNMDSGVDYIADGTTYNIVDGTAASTLPSAAVVEGDTSAVLSYALSNTDSGNDITLTVNRATYASLATDDADAAAAAAVLDTLAAAATGDLQTIQNQLDTLDTAAAVKTALETLAPATGTGVAVTNIGTQAQSYNTVTARLGDLRHASETGIATAADGSKMHAFWIEGFGSAADQEERKGEYGYDATTYGITLGADSDTFVEGYNIGAAFSYANSSIESDSAGSAETDVNSYQLAAYGSTMYEGYFINGLVSAAYNDYETDRRVAVGSFTNTARGEYDGYQFGLRAEVGRDVKVAEVEGLTLTPTVGVEYSHVSMDEYTETGAGGANLTVDPEAINSVEFSVGGAAKYEYMDETNGVTYTPELRAKLSYQAGDNQADASSTFAGGGAAFKTGGVEVSRFGGSVGTGLTVSTANGVDVSVNYDADIKADYLAHTGMIRARFAF